MHDSTNDSDQNLKTEKWLAQESLQPVVIADNNSEANQPTNDTFSVDEHHTEHNCAKSIKKLGKSCCRAEVGSTK